jgi:hypothetical protein
VKEVSGQILGVATTKEAPQKNCIIVGTLGHNEWIDQMIAKKKLDVEPLKDRWESYLVQLVRNPLPGVDKALVIVGSDRRGLRIAVRVKNYRCISLVLVGRCSYCKEGSVTPESR